MTSKAPLVFISYSRRQRRYMDTFTALLQSHGMEVIYDLKSLTPGGKFSPEIEKFIDDSSATLVIWTEQSVKSTWVKKEASRALDREKLVPIAIGNPRIPREFVEADTPYFDKDFYRTKELRNTLRRVIARIKDLAKADFEFSDQKISVEYLHTRKKRKSEDEVDIALLKPFSRLEGRMDDELRFIAVPSGRFVMGAKEAEFVSPKTEARLQKELCVDRPRFHAIVDTPFLIMQSPMTYRMGAWLCSAYSKIPHPTKLAPQVDEAELDKPITNISWRQVVEICRFLTNETSITYRLPTEVEWEYVARSGSDAAYWFGNRAEPRRAIYDHRYHYEAEIYRDRDFKRLRNNKKLEGPSGVAPVPGEGSPRHNPVSKAVDMLGNVYEWTDDNPGYEYKWKARVEARPQASFRNGTAKRIVRGGCYSSKPEMVRCAARAARLENEEDPRIGFRLVRECVRQTE